MEASERISDALARDLVRGTSKMKSETIVNMSAFPFSSKSSLWGTTLLILYKNPTRCSLLNIKNKTFNAVNCPV